MGTRDFQFLPTGESVTLLNSSYPFIYIQTLSTPCRRTKTMNLLSPSKHGLLSMYVYTEQVYPENTALAFPTFCSLGKCPVHNRSQQLRRELLYHIPHAKSGITAWIQQRRFLTCIEVIRSENPSILPSYALSPFLAAPPVTFSLKTREH